MFARINKSLRVDQMKDKTEDKKSNVKYPINDDCSA